MKNIALILLILSSVIAGCDRDTLKGLNLKINAEVKSDYDNEVTTKGGNNVSTETKIETKKLPIEQASQSESKVKATPTKGTNDPDTPMAFNEISDCSEAGIRAKTNEIFYSDNPQVKSIDSKNKEQVKKWKTIYKEVENTCN